jgi:hypothetical protein
MRTGTELTPYHFVPQATASAAPARTRSERRRVRAWRSRNSTPQVYVAHISESGRARGIVASPTTGIETTTAAASADDACAAPSSRAAANTATANATR